MQVSEQKFRSFLGNLGLKKSNPLMDELSCIPVLKDFTPEYIEEALKHRERTLKQRYLDNKSYTKLKESKGRYNGRWGLKYKIL